MLPEPFVLYMLTVANVPQPVISRVEEVYDTAVQLMPEPPESMMLADYYAEGSHEVEEVWFFSKRATAVAERFLSREVASQEIQVLVMKDRVAAFRMTANGYRLDVGPPEEDERSGPPRWTDDSWLKVDVATVDGGTASMRAAKGNCDALYSVAAKYFREWLA